jgi:hypothetical protein
MKNLIYFSLVTLTLSCTSTFNQDINLLSRQWQISPYGSGGEVTQDQQILKILMGDPICGINWNDPDLPVINYQIEFEARRTIGNDFFVGLTFPYKDTFCSLIVSGWGGTVTGLSSINGLDASENESSCQLDIENNSWYKIKLSVKENYIIAHFDDQQIIKVNTLNKIIDIRPEVEPSKPLGLATFYTSAEYKNIILRKLKYK